MATTTTRREREINNIGTTATDAPPPSSDRSFFGHPRGLSTLFFTEMWERFSYYGLRPLLVLFMTAALANGGFGFERGQASAIVGIYAACVYLASLPGGWVADRLIGLRRAIQYGAILISAGHICIGLSAFARGRVPFFLGLILIVLGTGLLKPNISAIVGDLYPEGGARRDAGFSIFYMGINLGAFAGQIITGVLGEKVGWHWGFGAAGVGMLLGLIIYTVRARSTLGTMGLQITRHPDPAVQARQESRGKLTLAIGLAVLALVVVLAATGVIPLDAQVIGRNMTYVMVGMAVAYFGYLFAAGGLSPDEKKRVAVIAVLFVFAAIFWSAFEQAPTSLNLFARDFTDRLYDTSWIPSGLRVPFLALGALALVAFVGSLIALMTGRKGAPSATVVIGLLIAAAVLLPIGALAGQAQFEAPATWFQSINSLFIILLAPAFAALWVTMARRGGDLSSPAKFAFGLLLAGVGFVVMIIAANKVVAGGGLVKVSAWWLVWSYFFQTVGELALSPVGLSSMTKLSPRKYVGQMMGIWFLAAAVGNLIAGLVGGHVDPEKLDQMPRLFTMTTIFLMAAAVVLALLIVPIRRMMATTTEAKS
ncbi:MAG: peptide MFS transporter [Gemmatimonadaceae bacterium]